MSDKKSDFEFPSDAEYATMVFEDAGELTVNLADVKELKFENIPKGTYLAEVETSEFGMSQNSGAPMMKLNWRIVDGEYAGRKLPSWLSFSPKALPGTKANLNRIAPELTTMPFKPRELCENGFFITRRARIRVDLGDYQGEKRSQIRGFMPAAGGEGGAAFGD